MAAGLLLGGTVAGLFAAGAALANGHPLLVAVGIWALAGTVTALGLVVATVLRAAARDAAAGADLGGEAPCTAAPRSRQPIPEPVEG
jgi:hypothetical protein